jgi:hypothetical protein
MLDVKPSDRGFKHAEFIDRYGSLCSLQESSLATEYCIWLGVDKAFDHDYDCTRMHLTQKMVRDLLPYLIKFVDTGEL